MPTVNEMTKDKKEEFIPGEVLRREIARMLHAEVCTLNHTDGCGWCYEESYSGRNCNDPEDVKWSCGQHKRYLDLAKRLEKKANWSLNDMKHLVEKYKAYNRLKKECNAIWFPSWKEIRGY